MEQDIYWNYRYFLEDGDTINIKGLFSAPMSRIKPLMQLQLQEPVMERDTKWDLVIVWGRFYQLRVNICDE